MEHNRLVTLLVAAGIQWSADLAQAQPVPSEQAVQRLQATLATIPHLNEADFLSEESGPRYATARAFIRERQCASRTANPLLAVSHLAGLSLRTTQQAGGPSTTADRIDLPLRVAVLSDVPNLYLGNMSALAASPGLPAEVGIRLKQEIQEAYGRLVSRTLRLIDEYDLARCARSPGQEPGYSRAHFVFVVPTH